MIRALSIAAAAGAGPSDIRITDVPRILVGEVPWTFFIEVVIRIVVIYLLLVASMRLMGKRMAAQTSQNELAALVSLAAAVGPAMQSPDRGLLPPILIAAVLVVVQRVVAIGTFKSERFEGRTQGDVSALVVEGELVMEELERVAMSRERVFSQLRKQKILNLGNVERAYLETNGTITVVKYGEPRVGLAMIPEWDPELEAEQARAEGHVACACCGHVERGIAMKDALRCDRCGHVEWRAAIRG